jgi:hypothetical protein
MLNEVKLIPLSNTTRFKLTETGQLEQSERSKKGKLGEREHDAASDGASTPLDPIVYILLDIHKGSGCGKNAGRQGRSMQDCSGAM